MITYNLHQDGVFRVRIEGPLGMEDIVAYLEDFKSLKNLPENLLLLYDLRKAKLRISAEDIHEISKLGSESTKAYTSVKTAFIVEECYAATYAYLFAEQPHRTRQVRKVFSQEEFAVKWLMNDEFHQTQLIFKENLSDKK